MQVANSKMGKSHCNPARCLCITYSSSHPNSPRLALALIHRHYSHTCLILTFPLHHSELLSEYGLENDCTLHIVLRQNQSQAQVPQPQVGQHYAGQPGGGAGMGAPHAIYNVPLAPAAPGGDLFRMRVTLQLARVVKLFAIIDAVFLILWSLQYPIFLIGLGLAVAGYVGAQNFKFWWVMAVRITFPSLSLSLCLSLLHACLCLCLLNSLFLS
jgi:hypothetical protein